MSALRQFRTHGTAQPSLDSALTEKHLMAAHRAAAKIQAGDFIGAVVQKNGYAVTLTLPSIGRHESHLLNRALGKHGLSLSRRPDGHLDHPADAQLWAVATNPDTGPGKAMTAKLARLAAPA